MEIVPLPFGEEVSIPRLIFNAFFISDQAKNADYKKMAKDTVQAGKDAKEFYDKA